MRSKTVTSTEIVTNSWNPNRYIPLEEQEEELDLKQLLADLKKNQEESNKAMADIEKSLVEFGLI